MVSIASGILNDCFQPIPEASIAKQDPDFCDVIADYSRTSTGAWDFFSLLDATVDVLKLFPSFPALAPRIADRIQSTIEIVGIGLSIPAMFSTANAMRRSGKQLWQAHFIPDEDSLKTRKIKQAAKRCFLDGLDFVNNLSQASLLLERVKILTISVTQMRILDGAYYFTSLVGDGFELIEECFKLRSFQVQTPQTEEKTHLSWMTIAKDVASISISIIALVGIIFVSTKGMAVLAISWTVLGAVWLGLKIYCYLYQKIVVEKPTFSTSNHL